jgi:serine phosphatase RsbU (regulator of sigma subunit)/anti-sigma regulatory factor (Ser/Thr protein kinase)
MSAITQGFRKVLRRRAGDHVAVRTIATTPTARDEYPPFDIAPDDPLLTFFATSAGAVLIDQLELDSPALRDMRAAGVQIVIPLVSQGELIGLLNLGPRLSERDYSSDDRKLLEELATHAAPAIRVAQLVREQEAEARERERVQQELRVATLIQQQFLPKELPTLKGWQVAAYYQSAREVGGDFYDFVELPDDQVGVVVGDVTSKGVPAALVMASTHSLLRAEATRLVDPGPVLERVNDLLVEEMPPNMFVTCLYAVLHVPTGRLRIANAGHNLPFVATEAGPVELRARGLPLGLMPAMHYEEVEATLAPGDSMLLHSDGLAEAHNPAREMFGFPRLLTLVGRRLDGQALIDCLLGELERFTGGGWEQEDDITLVALNRSPYGAQYGDHPDGAAEASNGSGHSLLAEFTVPSAPGNERVVLDRVAEALAEIAIPADRLERLKTAVAEAAMNAIEHGNENRPELPVEVRLLASETAIRVLIVDQGGDKAIPDAATPDIEAKLAGLESPRGWGLFLIKNMVDAVTTSSDGERHTIELVVHTEGDTNASQPV